MKLIKNEFKICVVLLLTSVWAAGSQEPFRSPQDKTTPQYKDVATLTQREEFIGALLSQIRLLLEQLNEKQEELTKTQQKLGELASLLIRQEQELGGVKDEVFKMRQVNKKYNQSNENLMDVITQLNQEHDDLFENTQVLQAKVDILSRQLNEKNEEVEKLKREIVDFQKVLQKNAALEQTVEEQQQVIAKQEQINAELLEEIERIKRENATLRAGNGQSQPK